MNILMALTYFRPHISGLTIAVERLARGLTERGHHVTVLTSRYDRRLPQSEIRAGVQLERVPVLCRIGKGVIMPSFGITATRLIRQCDALSLHLPQLDAAGLALRGRAWHKPTMVTYHCQLSLPPGALHRVAAPLLTVVHHLACRAAHAVVTHTDDYARHTPFLRPFAAKLHTIPPAVCMTAAAPEAVVAFRRRHHLDEHDVVIGMCGRLAAEKGVEVLARALRRVLQVQPRARVLYAGEHINVFGEEGYARRLAALLGPFGDRWRFLGVLPEEELPGFFSALSMLVMPSLNSTEAFGMVQVEAMLCGVPVVASDLPGVRQPIALSGMGRLVPPGDDRSLAEAILDVAARRHQLVKSKVNLAGEFNPHTIAGHYERIFADLAARLSR
ncbi:MAG: glycosyltransferase family 4 protein [Kiritimatiellaeota bacterium]|nr:glycosyltransferase family 4 protein [Kiritimatiellota bacterium]